MLKTCIFLHLFTLIHSTLNNVSAVTVFDLKNCGTITDLAQNVNLNIDPKLPQIDYTLFLDADLSTTIEGGTSKYDFTLNGLPFSPTINDLCTEINNSNITCPLMGHIASESKGLVPSDISGKIVIKNQWFDNSDNRILCMQFTIKL